MAIEKLDIEEIVILAMGPTWYQCPEKIENGEVWCVNTMYRNHHADRIFLMHDIRHDILVQDKDIRENINKLNVPFYTAGRYPDFKSNIPYPAEEIVEYFGVAYFLNVIAWVLAYAIYCEPKRISLYGVDMRSDAGVEYDVGERSCVEFWIGMALGRGIEVSIPEEAFLLKSVMRGNFYGYKFRHNPNGLDQLIPENTKRQYTRYKLIPLNDDGSEINDPAAVTLK